MKNKKCFKCKSIKPLSEFYKHPQMADGHLNKCKECNKKDVRKNRKNNIEYYKEYDKKRAMKPHRVQARKEYLKTDAGRQSLAKSNKNYRKRNPNKCKAHDIVNNAIRDKKLFKEPCEVCGSTESIHAHHDDYLKPLNVRWLCQVHHRQWHDENGEGLNG